MRLPDASAQRMSKGAGHAPAADGTALLVSAVACEAAAACCEDAALLQHPALTHGVAQPVLPLQAAGAGLQGRPPASSLQ